MITHFDDFCLWAYVVIDEIWQQICPLFTHPGPQSLCTDSELITLALVGECRGWDKETDLIQEWQAHRHLFPHLPERSRFNRRRRHLYRAVNVIRQALVRLMDLGQDRQCLLDSLPVPVVKFHLVPSSTGDWKEHEARFGKVPSKKMTIFGYKLHLLLALNGTILDFDLAPANVSDLSVGEEMLSGHTDLEAVADKAYISTAVREALEQRDVHVLTVPRRNQKQQISKRAERLINRMRQLIETVNGQLTEQFHIDTNHAHSFWGLCTRLYSKLTAHTLCIYINRLLGKTDFLQIKALAFPN
jgi:hypothetical protein